MSVTPLQKALRKKILLEKIFDCPLRKEGAYGPRSAAIVGSIVHGAIYDYSAPKPGLWFPGTFRPIPLP